MNPEQENTMKTTDNVSNFVHETADAIADATHKAGARIDEKSEQFMDAEQKLVKQCRGYVRENPVTALSLAVAGGFILSRVLSGR